MRHTSAGAVFGNPFRAFLRGMGRTDAYFHAAFGVILVAGFVFVAPIVDNVWARLNKGVRYLFLLLYVTDTCVIYHTIHASSLLQSVTGMRTSAAASTGH